MLKSLRSTVNEIMAMAVLDLFPGVLLGEGKVTATQFSYEFSFPQGIHPELLAVVSEKMRQLMKSDLLLERVEMATGSAVNYFDHHGQPLKADAVSETVEPTLCLIRIGKFYDIFRGAPYAGDLAEVSFQLLELKPEKREGLQWVEIFGAVFESKDELKSFIKKKKQWQKEMPWESAFRSKLMLDCEGVPVLLPEGVKIYQKLEDFWRKAVVSRGLIEVIGEKSSNELVSEKLRSGIANWAADHAAPFGPSDLCTLPISSSELLKACISSLQFIAQTFNMLELSAEWVLFTRNPGSAHKQWGHRVDVLTKALKESGFAYSIEEDSVRADPTVELRILDSLGEHWAGPMLSIRDGKDSALNRSIVYSLLGPVKRLIALMAEHKVALTGLKGHNLGES